MLRSISDADRAGDEEGQRHRDQQRIVEQAGIAGADHLLHHEGGVGADHHHLAMGHVDDAHHAEGDGKPDRGEQQHRAERQAVPGVLHRRPQREIALDRGDRAGRGLAPPAAADRCRGRSAAPCASWSPRALMTAMASSFSASVASDLNSRIAARASVNACFARLVGFLGERAVDRPATHGLVVAS